LTPGTGGTNIYRAELDANGKVSSPPSLAVKNFINKTAAPFLSPDGQYLAFKSGESLVIHTLKTGEERIVPTDPLGGLWNWFPDGRSVLVTRPVQQGQGATFLRVDLQTGKAEPLFHNQTWIPGVSLSPDGKTVFYSEPNRLVRYDLETQREIELPKSDAVTAFYSVAVSPDGKQLAYVFWNGGPTHSIMIIPASGGTPREVFRSDEISRFNSLAWTGDQKYLLVAAGGVGSTPNAKYMLWRVPISGGSAEQTGLSLPDLHFPQVHPDGRAIFFQSNDIGANEVWAFENFLPKAAAR
jgi:Tol biopolymer transport system component